jgi:two-component system, NarL family, nitrate/nitrite response regulator NarL
MASGPSLQSGRADEADLPLRVLILSDIRFLAEGLAQALDHHEKVSMCWFCTDFQQGLARIAEVRPDVVLLDAALQRGADAVGCIHGISRHLKVVVFPMTETSDDVIASARAGVAGYIPRTAALADVAPLLASVMHDEQTCSARVVASLLPKPSEAANAGGDRNGARATLALTAREMQVVELLAAGLSNKDIARRLNIGVATTKSHVHNLLGKLGVQRRAQVARWMRDRRASSVALPVELSSHA